MWSCDGINVESVVVDVVVELVLEEEVVLGEDDILKGVGTARGTDTFASRPFAVKAKGADTCASKPFALNLLLHLRFLASCVAVDS